MIKVWKKKKKYSMFSCRLNLVHDFHHNFCMEQMQHNHKPLTYCWLSFVCRRVIHTVGPKYAVKYHTAAENALSHCYRSCLELLIENGLQRLSNVHMFCGLLLMPWFWLIKGKRESHSLGFLFILEVSNI